MKWLIPENEIDIQQREFLDSLITNTNQKLIDGFPGSGKTILLLFAAKRLKDKDPNFRILFIEFTHSLIKMLSASIRELHIKDIEVVTYYEFKKRTHGIGVDYDYILCDEVQDVPRLVLEAMKRSAKHVIIAGDANQSIYESDPKWKEPVCTRDDIREVLSPDVTSLNIMHRLTKPIVRAVNCYLPEMNILAGKYSMVKKNTQIRLWKSRNQREEVRHIMDEAIDDVHNGKAVGILLPTHDKLKAFANYVLINAQHESWECKNNKYGGPDYDDLNKYFAKCDVPIQCVVNGYGDFLAPGNKITLITYHSAKGLDFDNVFLPFCNELAYAGNTMSKRLFMVAMTRSRANLFISYSADHMNQWVKTFCEQCSYKNWDDEGMQSLFPSETSTVPAQTNKDDDSSLFGF